MTTDELDGLLTDRQAAKLLKHRFYFPGSSCVLGHVAKRYSRNGECTICAAERGARVYAADPDRVKRSVARQDPVRYRAMRLRHTNKRRLRYPEKVKAEARRSREKHRDKVLARTKAWRAKNRAHLTDYGNKYQTAWRKANPEKARLKSRLAAIRRRATARKAPGRFVASDINRLMQEQDGRCAAPHCRIDIRDRYEVDHKIPLARGGSNWPANLQLLCESCNSRKSDKTMDEWVASLGNLTGPGLVCSAIRC